MDRPHVVVVGAGFGGLTAVRSLGRAPVDVTLIDQHNFHTFSPLLYQVATAGVAPDDIAPSVRGVVRREPNAEFQMAPRRRDRLRPGVVSWSPTVTRSPTTT